MKKIDGFTGKATKKSGDGHILYELWVNDHGDFFVKMVDNHVQIDRPGTHSEIFYSVKDYACKRDSRDNIGHPTGIDEAGKTVTPSDNNNGAFLKAVLCDLLPPRRAAR
jgi:hypothetical protein